MAIASSPLQKTYLNNLGGGTTVTTAPGSAFAGTNPAILIIQADEAGFAAAPTITGIADTSSNVWTSAFRFAAGLTDMECWICETPAATKPTITITFNVTTDSTSVGGVLFEWPGVASVGAVDQSGSLESTTTTITSPTLTPTVAGELVIFFVTTNSQTVTGFPTSPWTSDDGPAVFGGTQGTSPTNPFAYQVATGTTGVSTTWTQSGSSSAYVIGVTLKAAVVPAGPPVPPAPIGLPPIGPPPLTAFLMGHQPLPAGGNPQQTDFGNFFLVL